MEFEKRKAATLSSMNSAEADKSPKGTVDAPLIPLLTTLNSHPSYFTTSSCSGRITILSHPTTTTTTIKKKAKGGTWVFISHDPVDSTSLLNFLFPNHTPSPLFTPHPHTLVFRYEPLIISIECKDINSAQFLVSLAISCGFRESGITSVSKRVIIAIRCSIRLEVPLGDTLNIMVSPEYVEYLVGVANEKMEANRRRTDIFLDALLKNGFTGPGINVGSGEKELMNGGGDFVDGLVCGEVQKSESLLKSLQKDEGRDTKCGSLGAPDISLSTNQITTIGEPVEKLFLWGHSACTLECTDHEKVLVFGGFGGTGRHARRNDSLLLDLASGKLETIVVQGTPSPRLGHTSSVLGDLMFVVGGRTDPVNILNDVWVLNTVKNEWSVLQCTGSILPPMHRHAAAVVGSRIYVFGGITDDGISSSLYVLDTHKLEYSEICIKGEWPCPRHSHTMVAYGSQLYLFGGYDGERALGDLYSFDVQTCLWKKEKMAGRTPYARFSHSMFVYKNFIGIVGGCPVRQHYQELSLLDVQLHLWKHIMVNSIGKNIFVRCTANVVGNDLVMIGGGASCYAFGTKFGEPMKMDLQPSMSVVESSIITEMGEKHVNYENKSLADNYTLREIGEKHVIYQDEAVMEKKNGDLQFSRNKVKVISNGDSGLNIETERLKKTASHQMVASNWVLQLERKYAKLGKDILKKFGWLDLGRKVYSQEDGKNICFPVKEKFGAEFHNNQHHMGDAFEGLDHLHPSESFNTMDLSLNNISCSMALNLLMAWGATKLADEVVKVRKNPNSPVKLMNEVVASLIDLKGLPAQLLEQLPTRWERLGDIVVLPVTSFKDPIWDSIGDELWPTVAKSLGTQRLARQGRIALTGTRDSTLEILVGDNGWVDHRENGILYSFDATKCMFSWGNLSEKIRMAGLDCRDEVIVDLFAGIGYFALPFLVRANAKLVYACEWNPNAVEALRRNLHANCVAGRCIILQGDNRVTAPKGVADRICLGLLPTSEGSWVTAVRALRSEGGVLHVHGNVKDSEEGLWREHVSKSISEIAESEGYCWEVSVYHVERVKWYAPHVRHLVADIRCKQIGR